MMNTYAIGRVGAMPELKQTKTGVPVCTFSLAVDTGYGENKATTWLRCTAWRKQAEVVAQYVQKGQELFVEGTPKATAWSSKDGSAKANLELTLNNLKFVGPKMVADTQATQDQWGAVDAPSPTLTDEDIPF